MLQRMSLNKKLFLVKDLLAARTSSTLNPPPSALKKRINNENYNTISRQVRVGETIIMA